MVSAGTVLLVDADADGATTVAGALEALGHRVVCGARNQQRVGTLKEPRLTVAVGPVAAEVALATVQDAWGPLVAVVVPVGLSSGKAVKAVAPLGEALVLVHDLAPACGAVDVPVWVWSDDASGAAVAAYAAARGASVLDNGVQQGVVEGGGSSEDGGTDGFHEPDAPSASGLGIRRRVRGWMKRRLVL